MRISDWSSDVCSSDLGAPDVHVHEARKDGVRVHVIGERAVPEGIVPSIEEGMGAMAEIAPARIERVVETAIAEATGGPGPHGGAAIVDAILERHHQRSSLGRRRLDISTEENTS